jgi:hypothetical protein
LDPLYVRPVVIPPPRCDTNEIIDGLMFPHLWLQVTEDHVHAVSVEEIELKER